MDTLRFGEWYTVEPPIMDTLRFGEWYTVEPPIMDTLKSGQPPNPPAYLLSIYFYLRRRDNLTKCSSPTCPFFGGSTVYEIFHGVLYLEYGNCI